MLGVLDYWCFDIVRRLVSFGRVWKGNRGDKDVMAGVNKGVDLAAENLEEGFTVGDTCVGDDINIGVGKPIVDKMMVTLVTNTDRKEFVVIQEIFKDSVALVTSSCWYGSIGIPSQENFRVWMLLNNIVNNILEIRELSHELCILSCCGEIKFAVYIIKIQLVTPEIRFFECGTAQPSFSGGWMYAN